MDANYLTMTFDQLMERQSFISKKYTAAYNAGSNQEAMNQMLSHLESIRSAMFEIGYKQRFTAEKGDNDPFKDSICP